MYFYVCMHELYKCVCVFVCLCVCVCVCVCVSMYVYVSRCTITCVFMEVCIGFNKSNSY